MWSKRWTGPARRVEADIQHQRDSKGYDYKRKRTAFHKEHSIHDPEPSDRLTSDLNQRSYKANRFRTESQFEIRVKRPSTSSTPSAISNPPEATSTACMCERKRL